MWSWRRNRTSVRGRSATRCQTGSSSGQALIIDGYEPPDCSHFSKPDLQSQSTFPSEVPIDAAAVSLNAAHKLADAVFENGLPGHKPETQSILEHGKASAGKRGNTGEAATDIFARFAGREGQASLGSHFATDAIHLPLLQICDGMGRNPDRALSDGGIAHFNEALGATLECVSDVPAEATISDNLRLASRQLTIEPGGALSCNLSLEFFRRKDLNPRSITTSRAIVGLTTFKDISGDFPMILVDPFDMPCAT